MLLVALISYAAVAQKKELKSAQKLVDASLYKKALVALDEMQPLIENADAKYISHYYYLYGISKQKSKDFDVVLCISIRRIEPILIEFIWRRSAFI